MTDNLIIIFDAVPGDVPTLVIGRKDKDGAIFILQTIIGESAVITYCSLTGRRVDEVKKEVTAYESENQIS